MLDVVRVLGLHVKKQKMFLGVVEDVEDEVLLGRPIAAGPSFISRNETLAPVDEAQDLFNRIRQELRAISPDSVAMLETRLYSGWKYADAFARVSMITTVRLVCGSLGVRYEDVKTERVGRYTKKPAQDLEKVEFERFGFDRRPTYWTSGLAQAFAVAATVASGDDQN